MKGVLILCLAAYAMGEGSYEPKKSQVYAETKTVYTATKGDKYNEPDEAYVDDTHKDSYDAPKGKSYDTSYIYQGKWGGKCGLDGLYFKDEASFVSCSNGNSYVQPCAPGTRNSGYDNFRPGGTYGYRDFCDVNLVDSGYAAERYVHQPYQHRPQYHHYPYGAPYYGRPYGPYHGPYPFRF